MAGFYRRMVGRLRRDAGGRGDWQDGGQAPRECPMPPSLNWRRTMAFLTLAASLVLAACREVAPSAQDPAGLSPDVAEAAGFPAPVSALMGLLTGQAFDAERRCWPVALEMSGVSRSVCLRAGTAQWRPQDGKDRVFLHAHAVPAPGLERGVFAAIVAETTPDGRWHSVAKLRALPVGDNGECGCAEAELRRMGKNRWGWVFAAHDRGQRRFHAVMSSSAGLSEVVRLPVPEEGGDGFRHRVEFDVRDENAEAFALLHVVLRGAQPVDVRTHPFDAAQGRYVESPVRPGG